MRISSRKEQKICAIYLNLELTSEELSNLKMFIQRLPDKPENELGRSIIDAVLNQRID